MEEECGTLVNMDAPDVPGSGPGRFKPHATASDLLYASSRRGADAAIESTQTHATEIRHES
jgi:hypothetical protein